GINDLARILHKPNFLLKQRPASGGLCACFVLKLKNMAHKIFKTSVASVYPLYVKKAERKGRTQEEVDQIISWLTGYTKAGLQKQLKNEVDFETFFAKA